MKQYEEEQAGYKKDLSSRQVQMIALGGAIGIGLFLGSGSRLSKAGPSLIFVYFVCGLIAFIVVRALGELIMHRPSSGGFVSYAQEFLGNKGAYAIGWLYFLNWVLSIIAEATAIATYLRYWEVGTEQTQWIVALVILLFVVAINVMGVKFFGHLEYWMSMVKVVALTLFLLVGIFFIISKHQINGQTPGISMISEHGGLFPVGIFPAIILTQGVIFAYASIEFISIAAGEAKNAREVMPKAVNSVFWRIIIFYVGSISLLVLLQPWNIYKADESPFVTFFGNIGVPAAADIMNFVVITAALSGVNSGIYALSRILRTMGLNKIAPQFTTMMNQRSVPIGGVLFTCAVSMLGVVLNYVVPAQAFEIVLNVASVCVVATWTSILVIHVKYRMSVARGENAAVNFKLWGAPVTNYVAIAFLMFILVLTAMDWPIGTGAIALIPFLGLGLWVGWRALNRASS